MNKESKNRTVYIENKYMKYIGKKTYERINKQMSNLISKILKQYQIDCNLVNKNKKKLRFDIKINRM